MKDEATEECSDAESVCEEVKEGSHEDGKEVDSNDQIKNKLACGFVMYTCEQAVDRLKASLNISGLEPPSPFVSSCSKKCSKHGTCNEELGRCDCLGGFTGKDCEKVSQIR